LTGLQFAVSGFFTPIRTAILPELVSERELGTANTLSAATWSVMLSLGAAIGGVVSGIWGIYPAFMIDACTFLLSAFFIMQIRLERSQDNAMSKTLGAFFQQYLEGLNFLAKHRDILLTACHKSMLTLLAGSTFEIVLVTIAESIFRIGQGGGISLGLMFMMTGLGSGIGPIVARRISGDRQRSLSIAIIIGYLLIACGYLLVSPLWSFPSTLAGIALRGFGGGIVWTFSTQLLLQQLPRHISGRVFASEFAFFTFTGAIGALLVGRALDLYSISMIIVVMALLVLLPATVWTLWTLRQRPLLTDS
jgi:predicted MFS family arabinose efflux permease